MFSFFRKKNNSSDDERRISNRVSMIFVSQCDLGDRKTFSTVLNASKTGLGILLDEPLQIGCVIHVTLQYQFKNGGYDGHNLNLCLPTKVIWIQEVNPSDYEYPDSVSEKKYRAGLEIDTASGDSETISRYNQLLDTLKTVTNS